MSEKRVSGIIKRAVGTKDDVGKLRWGLMPWNALEKVLYVLEHGANKYGDQNWRYVNDPHRRYKDALLRHVIAYVQGEEYDTESGKQHLAHAICNALFLLEGFGGKSDRRNEGENSNDGNESAG